MRAVLSMSALALLSSAACTGSSALINDTDQRACMITVKTAELASRAHASICEGRMKTMRFATSEDADAYRDGCSNYVTLADGLETQFGELLSTSGMATDAAIITEAETVAKEIERFSDKISPVTLEAKTCAAIYLK